MTDEELIELVQDRPEIAAKALLGVGWALSPPATLALRRLSRRAVDGTDEDREMYLRALAEHQVEPSISLRDRCIYMVEKYLMQVVRDGPCNHNVASIGNLATRCVSEMGL